MGIWRIPVDEIDRPGSFASHMNRSIVLLLEVLSQLKDHDTLLKVSFMLQRTPDQGKKYLRDVDRQVLAKRAFFLTIKVLEDNLNKLSGVSEEPKALVPSMGEMTTTDTSTRPSAEDGKQVLPKKHGLTAGGIPSGPEAGRLEAPQGKASPPAMDTVEQQAEERPERRVGTRPGLEEPMDMEAGHWGGVSRSVDAHSRPADPEAPLPGPDFAEKPAECSRTPELSLEDLSIRGPSAACGTESEVSRRPSRKRKLLEDTESGKTLLLDAYRVWQQGQKVMTYDLGRIEKIMSETYMLIKQVDEDTALDQAVKFCQIQMATSAQRQSASDTPTTPKQPKENRDIFFPSMLPAPVTTCPTLPSPDAPRPPPTTTYCPSSSPQDQSQLRRQQGHHSATMAFLSQTEEREEPLEGLGYRQQESRLCQQMKMATMSPGQEAPGWPSNEPATCSAPQPICPASSLSSSPDQLGSGGELSKQSDPSRIRSRIPPNMPKLLIPSSVAKFPPEITVTPPTPTLLSPKGSISEETKQKLKNVILSSQSAANVKKETLCQPALEVQETSSQESSLESDTEEEEEEDDYMDI